MPYPPGRSWSRVDFGYFIRPPSETGTGRSRAEPCLGSLLRHPGGLVLVDTGMGSDPDVDAHYRPSRQPLEGAFDGVDVLQAFDPRVVVFAHDMSVWLP